MVVKKIERFSGIVSFEPECDFAQFNGKWVLIDAVYAVADNITDSLTEGRR
jgi:hypothetical protein